MFVLAHLGRSAVTRGAGLVEIGLFNPALHSLPGTDAFQIREHGSGLILPDVMPKKFRFVCPFRHRPGQA